MTSKRIVALTAGAMSAVLLALMAWKLRGPLVLLALAMAVAAAAEVVIQALERRGLRRGLALAITYGSSLLALGGIAAALYGPLLAELGVAAERAVRAYERMSARLPDGGSLSRLLATYLPSPRQMAATLSHYSPADIAGNALDTSGWVLGLLSALLIILILSLHWSASRGPLGRFALCLLPAHRRAFTRVVYGDMESAVGRQLAGGLLKAVVTLTVLAVVFRLIGLPFPTLLALVAAVLAVVPLVGVLLAPAIVLFTALPGVPVQAVAAAGTTACLILLLDRVVAPRLLDARRSNPVLEVVMLLVLSRAVGPLGLLAAPAVAAMVHITIRRLAQRRTLPEVRTIDEIRRRLSDLREVDIGPELASVAESLDGIAREAEELDVPAVEEKSPQPGQIPEINITAPVPHT